MAGFYVPPQSTIWEGRNSAGKHYLHELVVLLNLNEKPNEKLKAGDFTILGYNCDEGVRRNNGRPGAVDGYTEIVKQLAKLPGHHSRKFNFFDCGAVNCYDGDMEQAQMELSKRVRQLLALGTRPIVLGGGHDIALGHYMGLRDIKPGIINLDAHFDLRIPDPEGNSGTPFYQIAQYLKKEKVPFQYLVMGIRKDGNDISLFQTAEQLGVEFLSFEDFSANKREEIAVKIDTFTTRLRSIYLTIDLDVFSSAYASGVSAASPVGISPEMGYFLIDQVLKTGKVCSIDLAEMNPQFDRDGQTAKLAAGLVNHIMRTWPYSNQDL